MIAQSQAIAWTNNRLWKQAPTTYQISSLLPMRSWRYHKACLSSQNPKQQTLHDMQCWCAFTHISLVYAFKATTHASCLLQDQEDGLQQPLQAAQVALHYSTWQLLQQLPCALLPPTSHLQARLTIQDHPSLPVPITPALTPTQIPTLTPLYPQPCPGLSHS